MCTQVCVYTCNTRAFIESQKDNDTSDCISSKKAYLVTGYKVGECHLADNPFIISIACTRILKMCSKAYSFLLFSAYINHKIPRD